jgi:hypothetical protein
MPGTPVQGLRRSLTGLTWEGNTTVTLVPRPVTPCMMSGIGVPVASAVRPTRRSSHHRVTSHRGPGGRQ